MNIEDRIKFLKDIGFKQKDDDYEMYVDLSVGTIRVGSTIKITKVEIEILIDEYFYPHVNRTLNELVVILSESINKRVKEEFDE